MQNGDDDDASGFRAKVNDVERRSRNVDRSLRDRSSGHGVTRLQFARNPQRHDVAQQPGATKVRNGSEKLAGVIDQSILFHIPPRSARIHRRIAAVHRDDRAGDPTRCV